MERKHDENLIYLEFAKSIKFLGRVPTTSKIGSVKFDDFLEYAHENWNFYDNPRSAPFMQMADTLISKTPQEWSPEDVERILEMVEHFDAEGMMHIYALHGYYQVISDMRDLDYDSDTVQRVVRLLHEYLIGHNTEPEFDGKITPQFIAKYMAPFFLGGDIALQHERKRLIAWVKDHKKQWILSGISVTVITAIIIGLNNKEAIEDLWASIENGLKKAPENLPEALNAAQAVPSMIDEAVPVRSYTSPQEAFDVSQHIRTLSGGRHHSAEKVAEAAAMGITLLPNQTLVDFYTKCAA